MVTRIAPSPTGFFHFGTMRTAYFNYLTAKTSEGKFILRIDDTDLERNKDEYIDVIYQSMAWCGLSYDLTFKQSERLDKYREAIDKLLNKGCAYKAADNTIRFKPNVSIMTYLNSWHDELIGEIKISEDEKKIINDMVLIKSNGMPTYHFASVVDDIDYGVDHIIRGSDHIPNTSRQIALFSLLTEEDKIPKFSHVGLIFKDKKKISKRDGISQMQYYIDNNYNPAAVLNFILRLGWSPSDANYDKHTPLITKDLAEKIFLSEGKMKSSPSNFDQGKLDWYNKKYK